MKPIVQGSLRPNVTSGLNSPASAAPPLYRPNVSPAVQRMVAPAAYRPNPAGTAQRAVAPAVHSAQGNTTVQRAAAPAVYRPDPNAPVQRMAAPAVYKPNESVVVQRAAAPAMYAPNATVPVQQMAASPVYKPQSAVHASMATPLPMHPPSIGIPPRPLAAQPVMQAKQASATAGGGMAPAVTPRSNTIQREIYKFKKNKWVLEKVGTPGYRKPPKRPKEGNVYFNTVTGKKGPTIESVEAGLIDLMIVKGSLKDLKGHIQWPAQLWKELHDSTNNGSTNFMGTIRLKCDQGRKTHKYKWNTKGGKNWGKELKQLWNDLLAPFMRRNGQLDYIYGQKWFTDGDMVVDISVNFYNNRSAEDTTLGFHKDTSGDNLFVNLIFNNKQPILATEWVVDKQEMKEAKKRQMKLYMASDQVSNAIEETRASIVKKEYRPKGTSTIEGGLQTGNAGFVSWVDELIWHSSPYAQSRETHKSTLTQSNLDVLQDPKKYRYVLHRNDHDYYMIRKALRTLRHIPGTSINNSFVKPSVKPADWWLNFDDYINTIVDPRGNPISPAWESHLGDIAKNKLAIISPRMSRGEEQAPDKSNNNTRIERYMGLAPLRRRNSIIAEADGADATSLNNAAKTVEPRSFVRTWVQIHREDYPLTVVR
jgi:hypothetical protein